MTDDRADAKNTPSPRARRGGLGRGLEALIPTSRPETSTPATPIAAAPAADPVAAIPTGEPLIVELDAIVPNPYQPRGHMDRARLQELADSIRLHGVMQPLVVTRADEHGRYTLIAGERRWRASRLAGQKTVPVVVKDAEPQAMLELALIENVVRADLSPLEEALAYRQLAEEFGLTQAQIAERVGKSRVAIANTLRLLTSPERVQEALVNHLITEGHARALLGLPTAADQIAALDMVLQRELNVRQTEELVRRWQSVEERTPGEPDRKRPADELQVEEQLRTALGTRVSFKRGSSGQGGTVTIQFFSDEQLQALYSRLVGEDQW